MANTDTEKIFEQTVPISAETTQELLLVAQQGEFDVHFKLGNAYSVTQNDGKAITWYKKTAELQYINEMPELKDYPLDLKQWIGLQVQEKQRYFVKMQP